MRMHIHKTQLAEQEEDVLKEAFFSPSDAEMLQAMFDAFSQAAELNPEDGDDDDEELGDGEEGRGESGGGSLVFEHGRYALGTSLLS